MNVRWSAGDEYLISAGGNDKCVIIWKHKITESANSAGGGVMNTLLPVVAGDAVSSEDVHVDIGGTTDDLLFKAPTGGDESGCIKPWYSVTAQ
jgi:hypothetical protein